MISIVDKGSGVILQTEMVDETSQPKFKRMYVKFNAQKVGFLGGCRPFIGLHGCHIKHRFGGQILSATAKDDFSNNHGCYGTRNQGVLDMVFGNFS